MALTVLAQPSQCMPSILKRLRRETVIELASGAAFLGGDIVVFGRHARGERFMHGSFHELWEVRREGMLVWDDALHLEDDIAGIIDDPACFDRTAAFATMILSPPADPRDLLDDARAIQSADTTGALRTGVTAL